MSILADNESQKNLYVIMLGLVLVKSAGRIAGSVVSGNPSLDFGAVAHQMHGMSHAARSGMRMAKEFGNDAKQALQKSGTQVLDAASTIGGMNAAKAAATETAVGKDGVGGLQGTKLTDKQISAAGNQAARQFAKEKAIQSFKDGMFERLTGQKATLPQDGALAKVGRTYTDDGGHQKFASQAFVGSKSNNLASQMGRDKMQPYVDQAEKHAQTTTDLEKNRESGEEDKPLPKK